MEIWHKRLKELRQNTDVTLKDMAKIIGVSEATVQRYENGSISEIPYKAITAYAKKFKVNPSYIMGWTNTPNQNTLFDIVSKDEVSDYFESAMRATIESHKKSCIRWRIYYNRMLSWLIRKWKKHGKKNDWLLWEVKNLW